MIRWKPSLKKDSYPGLMMCLQDWSSVSYLLVDIELAEDLSRIEEVSVVNNPDPG